MKWWSRRGRYSRSRKIIRTALYPAILLMSAVPILAVAVGFDDLLQSLPFGPVLFAAAVSAFMLSVIRIGDGTFELQNGKLRRPGGRYAASFWLTAFLAICMVVLAFTLLDRLPEKISWPLERKAEARLTGTTTGAQNNPPAPTNQTPRTSSGANEQARPPQTTASLRATVEQP